MAKIKMSKDEKNKKYKRIGVKVGSVVAIMQVISVVLAVTICVIMFNSLTTKMLKERCINGTNILARELNKISDGDDINTMLDILKSSMGCEFTIFQGDTRAYSTVTQNGQRAVGTKLSSDLNKIVLQQGNSYIGEADILGSSYLCSYVPTKGANGQIDGLIFAGISMTEAKRETRYAVILSGIVSIITIIVCIMFLASYLKKRVSLPLNKITTVAHQLEKGDLGLSSGGEVKLDIQSNDEIGVLSQIFENTIHRLRSYIGEITSILGSIADGNLTNNVTQNYMGDFQSIKASLNSIQSKLNDTMSQITSSASQVSAGADQVSNSAQNLAQGATEQSISIQEISTTISDISENARQTSSNAEEAGEFVNQVCDQLGESMQCVHELNEAMENISNSSKEIGTIIATIENIAFQINILSLNAAVEAARAGAAGKGFAVVADEVRNLATKSDKAAKATKELIEGSITAVTEGSNAVEKVTTSLEQTNQIAGNVTGKMSTVVESVEKQTTAISQVTDGIEQISNVVQTNTATSEECAAASEELSSQANLLNQLISSFKLNDSYR